ncbi:MAG: DNA repair protein RecO [Candidatus Bruticola sp.]
MSEFFSSRSIVLHRRRLNENSELVILLSLDKGRIDAVCSGLSKPRSALRGQVEPFTELDGLFVKGRSSLARLTQAKTVKVRPVFYGDYECLCWGAFLLELFSAVAPGIQEGGYSASPSECASFFQILSEALDYLGCYPRKGPAVSIWVLERLLKIMGLLPHLTECAVCGKTKPLKAFNSRKGGLICEDCLGNRLDNLLVEPETVLLLQKFCKNSLASSLLDRFLAKVYAQAEYVLWSHISIYCPLNLKSRRLLRIGDKSLESFRH